MATYVLIPGSDGRAWYWHRVVPLLGAKGHDVVTVDLPATDPAAGLESYAEAVIGAVGTPSDPPVLVAQSLAGFIAPLVAQRIPVAADPRQRDGARARGVGRAVVGDVPQQVVDEAMAQGEPALRFDTLFSEPWPLTAWPDVPTRFLQGRDDRFFPLEFQRRVVRERLGIPVEELPGGHLVALSRPVELVERIEQVSGA